MIVLGIDQSLTGTGLAVVEDHKLVESRTIDSSDYKGMDRLNYVCEQVEQVVRDRQPHIIAIEDYARQVRNSQALIPLVELGGCIKWSLYDLDYETGNHAIRAGVKVLMVQNQSQMKKFCLGSGNVQKDSSYLLRVFERFSIRFADDNQADAFMHATMASLVYHAIQGKLQIANLPRNQQEVLISSAIKHRKGLSLTKALKLPDEEKQKLLAA
jgi:Holliday junction resolvasome RuvABC endonuclease subunit